MALSDEAIARYARHLVLPEIGGPGQQRLLSSKVLLIGAGGIGSPAALYLAAAGVGRLGIVDDDHIDLSNLQRQILHTTDRIGSLKTDSAAEGLRAVNPSVMLDLFPERLDAARASAIIPGYDLVLDGTDNGSTRRLVAQAAQAAGKPLVSAAAIQFSGQLTVFKPYLGRPHPCFSCLHASLPGEENCTTLGVLGAAVGVVGSLAAVEAVKELLGIGDSLSGTLLLYDALDAAMTRIRLPRRKNCPDCGG
ncbi:HesA/MoeB/ThiF family protein [Lacibacterium aquatile]|uniref:HesA/MoeB/ThiF family protein n=1 Tax=Lacibacterium aquatile TaxID=1168082 RepID=A0ABW5DL45_9PROT